MDKPQRHLMKMRHFRRRLKNLGLKACEGKFNSYRTTGKPCSCMFCDPHKHNPKGKHSTNVRAAKSPDR